VSTVMLNETAAKILGWDSPIGRTMKSERIFETSHIIGVVKDYHQGSLHKKIEPTVYTFVPDRPTEILLRIRPENKKETIRFIEETLEKIPTDMPLSYIFWEDALRNNYQKERQSGEIFSFAAILTIILSCLGLFGLTSFTVEQRTKEIGIRKVFGASVSGILYLLSMDFAKLVLFANIIAWPIAYYIMNKWLQNFAYKIGLNIWIFLSAGILVLLISLITMSSQSFKAATSNPVDTLRYE
ncbi:MAG: FtsX-like permease family protein, partial [bacterium]